MQACMLDAAFSDSFLKLQMLTALRSSPDSMSMSSMKDYIDPNMMDLYPHDCLFKVTIMIL